MVTVPRIMSFSLREALIAIMLGLLLFCTACEKHPLGQMPEVQREQADPAEKTWSKPSETESEKPLSSSTPVEFFPKSERP
jgi:hypothetical protein